MGPLLKLVQVPLDGILFFCHISWTTQLGVIETEIGVSFRNNK